MEIRLKLTAVLLTITGIFVASNIYTLIPIYENVSQSLHIHESHVVLAGSLFSLFYAIGLLYFGPASDQFGRRNVIIVGMLASACSTLMVGLVDGTTSLYIARCLQGLTLGSFAPVAFALIFDLYSARKRTLLLVFLNTGFLVAGILGQLISSTITSLSTWNMVYYFFAICYFILFLLSILVLPMSKLPLRENRSVFSIMTSLLKNKSILKCYGITFTLLFSFVSLYDAIGRFFGGSPEQLFSLRAVGLTGAILSLFTGRMIEKFGVERTMFTGFVIGMLSLISMSIFHSLFALMALSILFVASISLLIPTIITLIGTLGGIHRAKALTLYSFVLLAGASIASPIVMLLNFQLVLLLLVALFLLNFILGTFLTQELAQEQNQVNMNA
ncbi:MFS transporter [Robertmurraya massiliosenegalensis]|uniref:MFS transporter n=1 Tax=Robertmurraya TaxID=2837507 RepID=UPI0039A6A175